ncbi:MAG: HAD-IA family hydrolase [Desulfuromonas sp.]|nr:HAD-IA family hydrolase [Desulfuromonas sp.]
MDKAQGLIFDCDGVMFDSRLANLAYYNLILDHFDEPVVCVDQPQRAHLCHTGTSPQVFVGLLGAERLAAALDYAQTVDYDQFIPQLVPEPGLIDILDRFSGQLPLAIATNRGSSMVKILDHFHLAEFFNEVVTHQDVVRPKPYPDMILEVARRLQISAEHLTFVGDSELDQAAADKAGCRFVSYQWDGGIRIDHHRQLVGVVRT